MFSPTLFLSIIRPTFRSLLYPIIESLIGDDPADSLLNPGVSQISKFYQTPDHVPGQAWQYFTVVSPTVFPSEISKTTALAILGVLKDKLTGLPNAFIISIRSELG